MSLPPIRLIVFAAALVGAIFLVGCSDNEERVPPNRPVLVQVFEEADGLPVAGIKVIVMDPVANLPLTGPMVSGSDGLCNFGSPVKDDLSFLVFGGVSYRVHALPENWNGAGGLQGQGDLLGRDHWLLAPTGKSDPAQVAVVLLRRVVPDSLPRIAGKVVDAGTGISLDRVFVSLSPYMAGYQGGTLPSDDVTGGDGEFSVSQIPFLIDSQSGNLIQVEPLRFTRQGYRPVVWKFLPPNGSDNVDISGVTIGMEPVTAEDTGAIKGTILRDGLPAAGIVVGLGVVAMPGKNKAGPALPGWTAVTDPGGNFTIGNLPAGTYLLRPGYPLGDGVFFPAQPANIPWQVDQGQEVQAQDLIVLHEITPLSPANGLTLAAPPDSLFWTPVPGVTNYEVRFDRGVLPLTNTNAIEIPRSILISPGLHLWSVLAIKDGIEIVGATQIQSLFRFAPP